MSRSMALVDRQRQLAGWLLRRDPAEAPLVSDALPAPASIRLRVYADGYRWRLVEVLGHDFPALRASLGEDRFDTLAEAYLAAHPSRHPSVRHLGQHFPRWLALRDATSADLARLEWQQGEVFDAADAPACSIDDVAALSPEAWTRLRLHVHPAVRRLRLRSTAVAVLDAHARGQPLPALRPQAPTAWLLWRAGFDVHWRRLPRDEAMALVAIERGDTFADWCVRLHGRSPAMRAARLLKRWLSDGLVADLSFPA
ncbi:DNA-binding domain-containing protein [uncultured Pseudoxanthomonas sp.]|uniref:DNA-binding domain-containing protein n=1 Tax=uncultured Pseudoxanthomonas sp. TaxID=281701 RepID=UPI00261B498A|nr:DNA-binding domain-containing protein [uncultured Pseudoxanthomonas sp.]